MQQTILAIGALLIIMTTAMLYQRSNIITQELAYIRQIEVAAEDAARMRLEGLATLAYDEGFIGWGGSGLPPNYLTLLTDPAAFGADAGESAYTNPMIIDDIDDLHGVTDTVWQTVSSDSFRFAITYTVQYVTPIGTPTTTPTDNKELIAEIESLTTIGYRKINGVFSKLTAVTDNL